jgi:hypothetical protein
LCPKRDEWTALLYFHGRLLLLALAPPEAALEAELDFNIGSDLSTR